MGTEQERPVNDDDAPDRTGPNLMLLAVWLVSVAAMVGIGAGIVWLASKDMGAALVVVFLLAFGLAMAQDKVR